MNGLALHMLPKRIVPKEIPHMNIKAGQSTIINEYNMTSSGDEVTRGFCCLLRSQRMMFHFEETLRNIIHGKRASM
jgi:hypothetical protein